MAYPSIEQYQEALQHPANAFVDTDLKTGKINSTALGLPLVASGGFALTYGVSVGTTKWAVRCFHKEAKGLERRYEAISRKLNSLSSPYFVKFEYKTKGVNANGGVFPIVRMAWAQGKTLGDFVETYHTDRTRLTSLVASLQALGSYLESQGIAHGDIQEGNLMVADDGRSLQLIDYDGMYVPELQNLGSSELGHRDYQHPQRSSKNFDASLDRFSLIALNLALRALCEAPKLWASSQSGAGVILLRANDYAAPSSSKALADIAKIPSLARDAKSFIAICAARFDQVPSLAQFIAGSSIPSYVAPPPSAVAATQAGYLSQYPVLNGANYAAFAGSIGQMVELVGRIVDVSLNKTKYGNKPYIFINFANWKGQCVKINLWSDALLKVKESDWPTASLIGTWITIRGLVEPVYRSAKFRYEHISITAGTVAQISSLPETQAQYRLAGSSLRTTSATVSNAAVLDKMKTGSNSAAPPRGQTARTAPPPIAPMTANQQALDKLRQQSRSSPPNPPPRAHPSASISSKPPANSQGQSGGFFDWLFGLFK